MSKDKTRRMDRLLDHQGGRCHWCGCRIVRIGTIEQSRIVILKHHFIVWRKDDGRTDQALVASLDHFVPASRGGANGLDNLVAACRWCNEARGNRTPEEILDNPMLTAVVQATPPPSPAPRTMPLADDRSRVVFW